MANVSLRDQVAKANLRNFERGIDVTVTASVLGVGDLVEAVVRDGVLHLEATTFAASLQVAWLVDTGAGNA